MGTSLHWFCHLQHLWETHRDYYWTFGSLSLERTCIVVFAAGDGDVPDPILPVLQEEHPPAGRSGPGLRLSGQP